MFVIPPKNQSFGGYIGITLFVSPYVYIFLKCNSSLVDVPILIIFYTDAVYNLRMSIEVGNPSSNYIKGDH